MPRVFVSSTTHDLSAQRESVAGRLREMNVQPVVMEDFPADRSPAASVCAQHVAGCDMLIVLVGFRCGQVVQDHPRRRTITQIEVEEAVRRRIPVLAFLMRDFHDNRPGSPPLLQNTEESGDILGWRQYLCDQFTPAYFNLNETPDVIPSVHRQLINRTNRRLSRARLFSGLTFMAFIILAGALATIPSARSRTLVQLHKYHDPTLFSGLRDDQRYDVARVFDGRTDLQTNTNFQNDVKSSNEEFCMFANNFASFKEHESAFEEAANRKVKFRFILTDYFQEPRPEVNFVQFQGAVENMRNGLPEAIARGKNSIEIIEKFRDKFPGQVQVRLNRMPIFYTMWIRDYPQSTAMAHTSWHYYGPISLKNWPAIRVSKVTGGSNLEKCYDQFNYAWGETMPSEIIIKR
jgi:hypothetical protein